MENVFIECMVRREDQTARIIKKVGMILGAVVIIGPCAAAGP